MRLFSLSSRCLTLSVMALLVAVISGNYVSGQTSFFPAGKTPEALAGTDPLTVPGDIASELVAGADKFLLKHIEMARQSRVTKWERDLSSPEAYQKSVTKQRELLAKRLGLRDMRKQDTKPRLISTPDRTSQIASGEGYVVHRIEWASFGDCYGRGLMLEPVDREGKSQKPRGQIVAFPDCEVSPEQLVGIVEGVKPEEQYARIFAENGFRVVVPLLVNRAERMPKLSNREWLYRAAFEMGRGMVGYEVQEAQALIDWMQSDLEKAGEIGLYGWGEGGLLAFYTGAVDTRVQVIGVSGYFESRDNIWEEPIDRNIFGLLETFGDAEIASLIAPRHFIVEAGRGPEATFAGGKGAPYRLRTPTVAAVEAEVNRAKALLSPSKMIDHIQLVKGNAKSDFACSSAMVSAFMNQLASEKREVKLTTSQPRCSDAYQAEVAELSSRAMQQKIHELNMHSQHLLRESHYLRQAETMSRFDYSSVEAYEKSAQAVRNYFYEDVIGRFDDKVLPFQPKSRLFMETENWVAYEVTLNVYEDLFAYGLLLLPRDLKKGERRPVVVCQHGLEGRPQDTIGEKGFEAYKAFSSQLAGRGYVVFAPQNLYIFTDRFRSLQRKANPLKKTLFSLITPQHQQIVDWLQSLDFVDPDRVGFYGLSYGGKTAMRVPALVTDYKLSICSADFNEWVDKNASTRNPRSYTFFGEYEIFEFDLGSTFNYAEMAALIAPRPFMVERGHDDGVGDDWTVAYEYAKVQNLYSSKLKIPTQTEIEYFDGPHTINGVGTFRFLDRHLNWSVSERKVIK